MNSATHPVAPEELMAFLDGELSDANAQTVGAHVAQCAECAKLAEEFRRTSQSLSRWNTEAVPLKLENSVAELAARTHSALKIGKANWFARASFWSWKQWTVGLGATAAALVVIAAIATPHLLRSSIGLRKSKAVAELRDQQTLGTLSSNSEFGRLEVYSKIQKPPQVNGRPITDQQAKVFSNQIPALSSPVTSSSPGVAADSNGLFHGLGDLAANSFSVDGQLSMVAPMIARTVSLSIVVKDFTASRASLDSILARHHGYSAQLNVSTPENAPRALQASLRIPAPDLSSAVADLKTIGRVENESQSGEEVTQQHTDLVARLKTSRETEQRFRTILQQRTGNAVEILQVEEGIARVRGDIERMEAEQKALEHRVDFATVDLQLTEEFKAQLNPPAASVSTRVHNAFVTGYRNASETVIGIGLFGMEYGPSFVIWLLILALPVLLVRRRYRRTIATI